MTVEIPDVDLKTSSLGRSEADVVMTSTGRCDSEWPPKLSRLIDFDESFVRIDVDSLRLANDERRRL